MRDLLLPVLLVEAGLVLGGVVAMLVHMGVRTGRARWVARRLREAEQASVRALALGNPHGATPLVARVPAPEALLLLVRLSDAVTGSAGRTVTAIARRSGLLARVERRASSPHRWRRLKAVRLLTRLGGGADVVPARLDDRVPQVRAQAASWVARHGDDRAVAALVGHLVDADRLARFAAADAIVRLGPRAAPALADVLRGTRGEALAPALAVASALGDEVLLEPVRACAAAPEPEVRAAAVRALSLLGGVAEAATFELALSDPDERVRTEAVKACGRTSHWRVAPRLGELLRDGSWDVRRASGLALRALGGPGTLVLRRCLRDGDRFAADMAQLVLDEERLA